jgi:hypothetical protein
MQSVERSKNESEMDNSPVIGNNSKLNGAESTFLGQRLYHHQMTRHTLA